MGGAAGAATPEPTLEQVKFFEEKVRPILAENCYKCHGSDKQKGGTHASRPSYLTRSPVRKVIPSFAEHLPQHRRHLGVFDHQVIVRFQNIDPER